MTHPNTDSAERGPQGSRSDHYPARWTPAILDAIEPLLAKAVERHGTMLVVDPFAGTGQREVNPLTDRWCAVLVETVW